MCKSLWETLHSLRKEPCFPGIFYEKENKQQKKKKSDAFYFKKKKDFNFKHMYIHSYIKTENIQLKPFLLSLTPS